MSVERKTSRRIVRKRTVTCVAGLLEENMKSKGEGWSRRKKKNATEKAASSVRVQYMTGRAGRPSCYSRVGHSNLHNKNKFHDQHVDCSALRSGPGGKKTSGRRGRTERRLRTNGADATGNAAF